MSPKSVLPQLLAFDAEVRERYNTPVSLVGLDEVGRGCLMGPVVAAAAIFPCGLSTDLHSRLARLNDSKKLNATVRADLYTTLQSVCLFGVGWATPQEIDLLNIHHASLLAMERALENLCGKQSLADPLALLIDGKWFLPEFPREWQQCVIQGDGQSASIAAASILAKHTRDQFILELAQNYPGYGWETNVGYGTPAHREGLLKHGVTPHHRQSFLKGILSDECQPVSR